MSRGTNTRDKAGERCICEPTSVHLQKPQGVTIHLKGRTRKYQIQTTIKGRMEGPGRFLVNRKSWIRVCNSGVLQKRLGYTVNG